MIRREVLSIVMIKKYYDENENENENDNDNGNNNFLIKNISLLIYKNELLLV